MFRKGSLTCICNLFDMKKLLCQKLEKGKVWIEITMFGTFLFIFIFVAFPKLEIRKLG